MIQSHVVWQQPNSKLQLIKTAYFRQHLTRWYSPSSKCSWLSCIQSLIDDKSGIPRTHTLPDDTSRPHYGGCSFGLPFQKYVWQWTRVAYSCHGRILADHFFNWWYEMKPNILIVKFYYIKLYATSKMFCLHLTQHHKYLDRNNLYWHSRNTLDNDILSVEGLEYITGVL